jgi:thiosulfate dehydrogenase [quinone] large subunit
MKLEKLTKEQYVWVGLRLALGWTLFWAFIDKLFGLGYATKSSSSWLNGGSPTAGYLQFATSGPLADFWNGLSGNSVVDALFMLALVAVGAAVLLGIGQKISGISGAALMLLLWSTNLPPSNNPIIDDHIINAIIFIGIIFVKPGKWWGLGKWWANTPIVKKYPILE